jgi:hypothetical protein
MSAKKPYQFVLFAALVSILLVTACSRIGKAETMDGEQNPTNPIAENSVSPTTESPPDQPSANRSEWEGQTIVDSQGAVEVAVTPVNLNNPGETIDFEVSLDTHSVDLSMDLGALATLSTGEGRTVQASLWDAPLGGHHVGGILSFPASDVGGPLLEGAEEIRLIISGLSAPERIFLWQRP